MKCLKTSLVEKITTYSCFSIGVRSNAPWKMCTIKFIDSRSFSSTFISPKAKLPICWIEFSLKSSLRKFVKLANSFDSIVDNWFLLKSLRIDWKQNMLRSWRRKENYMICATYNWTMSPLMALKSISFMLVSFVCGKPPHLTFKPFAFSFFRQTHFSGQLSIRTEPVQIRKIITNRIFSIFYSLLMRRIGFQSKSRCEQIEIKIEANPIEAVVYKMLDLTTDMFYMVSPPFRRVLRPVLISLLLF